MRIAGVKTKIVSLPLDPPVITPIHRIAAIDNILVELESDEGVSGIAYLWCFGVRRARVLDAMVQDLGALARGMDPRAREALWQRMWHDTNFIGRGGVAYFGMSAIEIAAWDMAGKACGQPVWQMLGGARRAIPAYAGGLFLSDGLDAIVAEARGYVARGFKAIKMRAGAARWQDDVARVEAVRAAIGPDIALLVDVVQGWTPETAIRMGRELARFDLYYIEDPVLFDDLEGMARIAAALDTPIAAGENDYGKHGFRRLIETRAVDIPMIDLQRVGGIGEFMKVVALAEAWRMPVVPHVFHEIAVHCMAAAANGLFLEYVPWWDKLFAEPLRLEQGGFQPSARPGLGLTFDHDFFERFRVS